VQGGLTVGNLVDHELQLGGLEERFLLTLGVAEDQEQRQVGQVDALFAEGIQGLLPGTIDVRELGVFLIGGQQGPEPPRDKGQQVDQQEENGQPGLGQERVVCGNEAAKVEALVEKIQAYENGRNDNEMDGPQNAAAQSGNVLGFLESGEDEFCQ